MQHENTQNCTKLLETIQEEISRRFQLIQKQQEEILKAIRAAPSQSRFLHSTNLKRRGPKGTRMMNIQRTALFVYVTVELHKNILDVTLADAHHVWHQPENVATWNEAANRKDQRRGYKDYTTLYGVVKALAVRNKLNIVKITAV